MPKRDDDDIEVMAGLSVDRDDARYRHKPKGQSQTQAPGKGQGAIARPAAAVPSKSISSLLALLVLVLLLVCGWLGQQVWQMKSEVSQMSSSLDLARKRIDQLGQEVFVTGSSFTESGDVIEKKFKFFDSEIRKLWDVSNKRNKAAIKKNTSQVGAISGDLKKIASQNKSSQSQLKSLQDQQAGLTKKLQQVNSELVAENTTMRATIEDQSEQMLLVRGELELLQRRLKSIPNDLAQRVKNNEEAVEAIDAARRQLINSINQLQSRLNLLQGGAAN